MPTLAFFCGGNRVEESSLAIELEFSTQCRIFFRLHHQLECEKLKPLAEIERAMNKSYI